MHIGVDVGGTNTDAALIEGDAVLAQIKSPTTEDVASGVIAAIASVLEQGGVGPSDISSVMIGTAQFANAFGGLSQSSAIHHRRSRLSCGRRLRV